MSKKLYEESNIQDIATAIREKNGTLSTYTTAQMGNAVRNIPTQGAMQTKEITPSGSSQIVEPDAGYDGLASVTINGDTNLVPSNIKNGVRIFGVDGNYEGGGGTASFDNILVGSTDPDASIGTPGDMYIKTYVNRVDNHAYHILEKVFYKSSQNMWLDDPDVTLPYSMDIIRIIAHSTSGSGASIDVYINGLLYTNILYTTVQGPNAHYFEDIRGLFIGYSPYSTVAPDGTNRNGWVIFPPMNSRAFYLSDWIVSPNIVKVWSYNEYVDFELLIPT